MGNSEKNVLKDKLEIEELTLDSKNNDNVDISNNKIIDNPNIKNIKVFNKQTDMNISKNIESNNIIFLEPNLKNDLIFFRITIIKIML